MLRHLLVLPLLVLATFSSQAQFRYTFKDTVGTYTALAGASSINGTTIWDDDVFTAPMPFTWRIDSVLSTNTFSLNLEIPAVVHDPNSDTVNGFLLSLADFVDRGNISGSASLSPIRYLTAGTSPNRIFKVEIANAGFYEEESNYSTLNDSVSFQFWVYEGSNVVELHFGPSRITHFNDYFQVGSLFGYVKNIDETAPSPNGPIYHLTGATSTTVLDTTFLPNFPQGLDYWPASGRVFRFTPKWKACTLPTTPTFVSTSLIGKTATFTYTGNTSGLDSLVWTWGDGQTTKVTTGYTAPVSHTYSSNGRYNVAVTAYNTCGSTTSATRQAAVSVAYIAYLANVQLFPNPASNQLSIEGIVPGSSLKIYTANGQLVIHSQLNSPKVSVDISALSKGSYTILVTDANGHAGTANFVKH